MPVVNRSESTRPIRCLHWVRCFKSDFPLRRTNVLPWIPPRISRSTWTTALPTRATSAWWTPCALVAQPLRQSLLRAATPGAGSAEAGCRKGALPGCRTDWCRSAKIVWTQGATESNNLALKGAAQFYQSRGKHIITVKTEHKAVLDTCRELERQGFEVTYLDVRKMVWTWMRSGPASVPTPSWRSVMFCEQRIGVIQDIAAIGAIIAEKGGSSMWMPPRRPVAWFDLSKLPVDLMSLTAHKTHGPKGGSAVCASQAAVRLEAQMHGGGHERGMRSGTCPRTRSWAWGWRHRQAGNGR